jgi:hypothetical protein
MVSTYASDDVADALACINANGGVDGMSLSYYARGEDGAIPGARVFRLEGAGAVFYFRLPARARLHQHHDGRRRTALIR